MLTTLVFLAVFSILILIHEWGHFIVARRVGVRVERFSLGFGPRLMRWQRGETEYCLSLVPLGGYVKMAGEHAEEQRSGATWEFLSKSIRARTAIVAAGPALNYLLAWVAFIVVFLLGYPALSPTIGEVLPDKPAALADVRPGDRIRAINGAPLETWDEVIARIHARPAQGVRLTLEREGAVIERTVVPETHEIRDIVGRRRSVGLIGIVPSGELVHLRYGLGRSIIAGSNKLWEMTALTCQALVSVVTGRLSPRESLAGPVGIFIMTGEAARMGVVYVIHILAILSMSLAIFNVLPIPVLDGGHLLFLALEQLRGGRPLSLRIRTAATQVGLALLVTLMVVVLYTDLSKFGITEKVGRWWRGEGASETMEGDDGTR